MQKHVEDKLSGGNPPDSGDLIRISEAARTLSVSRSFVYTLMDRRELAYVRLGKSRRIPRQALRNLIADNLVESFSGAAEESAVPAARGNTSNQ